MVVNDNAGSLAPRGVLGIIASKLAPTGGGGATPPARHRQFPDQYVKLAPLLSGATLCAKS
ncbi:hypothetical protein AO361_21460 [Pseudomonas fluorescens]|nr:hypothetical protein AO361_21460 [Pseudomonas fluorescens]